IKQTANQLKANDDLNLFFDGNFDFNGDITLFFDSETKNDSILHTVKKMPNNWQRVGYKFPGNIVPSKVTITLPSQSETAIQFDKIVFNKNNDRIIIKDSALLVYFNLKNLNPHFINNKVLLKKKDSNEVASLESKLNLINRLQNRYLNR